jgi:hypothetical protein
MRIFQACFVEWVTRATNVVVFFGTIFTIAPYLIAIMLVMYFAGLASKLAVILWVVLGAFAFSLNYSL